MLVKTKLIFLLILISVFATTSAAWWRRRRSCSRRNCAWASWGGWGRCSRTCGHGTRVRYRGIAVSASCGGSSCGGSNRDVGSCNERCCKVNCVWGSWGKFGSCSATCGIGSETRSRKKLIPSSCGGADCSGSNIDSQTCNDKCCAVDCVWGTWSKFQACSVSCGGGTQTRTRSVQRKASCGGKSCSGPSTETHDCNNNCCPAHCRWGAWGDFQPCSASCGGGLQVRSRRVVVHADCGGARCTGENLDSRSCNDECCPVDCRWGAWSKYGACSATCGGGTFSRSRQEAVKASCGGSACSGSHTETHACNPQCCPVDCRWGPWGKFGKCSAKCPSTRTRFRKQVQTAECGGEDCSGTKKDIKRCNNKKCCKKVDCKMSQWGEWGKCSAPCKKNGHTSRTRSITTYPKCGGQRCLGKTYETKLCKGKC